MGNVRFIAKVDGQHIEFFVENVLYVPGAEYGLFSPGFAHNEGFEFEFDITTRCFAISQNGKVFAMATPQDAT